MKNAKYLRKKLRNLSNQKHRENPEDRSLRLHNSESLKQYRNTLWKKKEQNIRNKLNVVDESIDSNHFWENCKTLNKQQHKVLSIQNTSSSSSPLFGLLNLFGMHVNNKLP
jgi:hypothetical protein